MNRVFERKEICMKTQSPEGVGPCPVFFITGYRMADISKMDPYLVLPSGLKEYVKQGIQPVPCYDPILCYRELC